MLVKIMISIAILNLQMQRPENHNAAGIVKLKN